MPTSPTEHAADTKLQCSLCGGTIFHRSRLRLQDLTRLFMFQLPLRCHECGEREYVAIPAALKAAADSRAHSAG
jgi:ribosomal protein L33